VKNIFPQEGSSEGGTPVVITGAGFESRTAVSFGGKSAADVGVVSSNTIIAITPAHAPGSVTVRVTNSDGRSDHQANGFNYIDRPKIDAVPAPDAAPAPLNGEVVLYPGESSVRVGNWQVVPDATAAGGSRLWNPNAGAAKLTTALAAPAHYFEMTFNAEAGKPYRLWLRSKAESDYWGNDSVFVQFSVSVNQNGAPAYRIGTTGAAEMNLEDCSGCGLAGWGWQDNGWGVGVLGPVIYFESSGPQTVRVQVREDGLSLD
jgi:hypothetical protein